jgi:hypothetical protein
MRIFTKEVMHMTTVLKKALCDNGIDLSDMTDITKRHERERKSGRKRHYFLGGLLHINGMQIDNSLVNILRDITKAEETKITSYIVTINAENNGEERMIGETADQMHNLKNAPLTPQGVEASHLIMGDDALLDDWAALPANQRLGAMNEFYAQIVLTGYSYGTSLIQQMERDLTQRLTMRGLPLEPLRNVKAMNMGAVDIPCLIGGVKADFNNVSAQKTDGIAGFSQIFAIKSNDKIMNSVIGRDLVPARDENQQMQSFGTDHLTFIVDYTRDSYIKRIGITRFAEGREVPQLNMNYDPEAHDLRIYLNNKSVIYSNSGMYRTYPTSPLSTILREGVFNAAAARSVDVAEYRKPDYIKAATDNHNALSREFEAVVALYEDCDYSEAIDNIGLILSDDLKKISPKL